ncbi:MAG: glucosaminidase domain-containing protein [Mariprofundaceae bacterium]|nr:glucosaminidase domain-containing protein [Mariprofundaceae bacterium]
MKSVLRLVLMLGFIVFAMPAFADDKPDFTAFKNIKEKKKAFFEFMHAYVAMENAALLKDRERLLALRSTPAGSLSGKDTKWLKRMAKNYRTELPLVDAKAWGPLLRRVDVVPSPLVLAQSANESSWGTSRFARQGHNFFGQWCFTKGCGIVPGRRDNGSRHEVAVFKSARDSVRAYLKNINTGRVYSELRKIRARQRANGEALDAIALAGGLSQYSKRGEAYVKEIRSMIRTNTKLM